MTAAGTEHATRRCSARPRGAGARLRAWVGES